MSFRAVVFSALTGVAVWALVRSFRRRVGVAVDTAAGANLGPVADSSGKRSRRPTSAVQRVVIDGRQISIPLAIWDGSLERDTEEKAG